MILYDLVLSLELFEPSFWWSLSWGTVWDNVCLDETPLMSANKKFACWQKIIFIPLWEKCIGDSRGCIETSRLGITLTRGSCVWFKLYQLHHMARSPNTVVAMKDWVRDLSNLSCVLIFPHSLHATYAPAEDTWLVSTTGLTLEGCSSLQCVQVAGNRIEPLFPNLSLLCF